MKFEVKETKICSKLSLGKKPNMEHPRSSLLEAHMRKNMIWNYIKLKEISSKPNSITRSCWGWLVRRITLQFWS